MEKTTILALLAVVVVVGVGVAFGYSYISSLSVAPRKAHGYFDSFGANESLVDHIEERHEVEFDDGDQDVEGNATVTYILNKKSNESFTGDYQNYVDLSKSNLESGSETVYNASSGSVVPEGDYLMNYSAGSIKTDASWDTENLLITYNWMDKRRSIGITKTHFEIKDKVRGGTIKLSWGGTNVTEDNTFVEEASIKEYESNDIVYDISEGNLGNEDKVTVGPMGDKEYILYIEFKHDEFLPNRNSGTYEEGASIDFTLDSDVEDEPIEVDDFTIFAKTVAP